MSHVGNQGLLAVFAQGFEGDGDHFLRRALRCLHLGDHVGIDVGRVHADHQGVLFAQLAAQAVCQAPLGGFRGAVAAGAGRAQPAQDREDINQRAAAVLGQDRREGAAHAQGAEGVHVKVLLQVLNTVCGQQRAVFEPARVVDQHTHISALLGGALHAGRVGNVQRDRRAAGNIDTGRVARTGVHLGGAGCQQRGDECFAQATVGAGDQYDFSTNIHDELQATN